MAEDFSHDSKSSLPVVASSSSLRVLIADHRVIADCFAMILNRSGFFAVPTYSGKRAERLALIMQPDIAMVELLIPGPGLIETCMQIKKYVPACRLIVTTGMPRSTVSSILKNAPPELGEIELIFKPFSPADAIALLGGPIPPESLLNL